MAMKRVLTNKGKNKILSYLKNKGESIKETLKEWYIVPLNMHIIPSTPDDKSKWDRGRDERIRYYFDGPKDNRNRSFCAQLLSMDKFYRKEDIINMVNDEFETYDPFIYNGSYNCRHSWVSVTLRRKLNSKGEPIDHKITDGIITEETTIEVDKRNENQKEIDNNHINSFLDILKPSSIEEKNEFNKIMDTIFINRSISGVKKLLNISSTTQKTKIKEILETMLIYSLI